MRASSRQRDRAVRSLGMAYRHGLLNTGTLELRLEEALAARTVRELRRLLADVHPLTRLRAVLADRLERRCAPATETTELVLPIGATRLTIGRHAHCDVVLDDPWVSRFHASLRREDGRWVLHDLGSRNGTFLNDRRASHVEVRPGDELRLGAHRARIVAP